MSQARRAKTTLHSHLALRPVCVLLTLLGIAACGAGNDNGLTDSPATPASQNPPPGASAPAAGVPELSTNSALPASLNQSFNCNPSKQSRFTLIFDSSGQVQYSDNNGGTDTGSYTLTQSGLSLTFSSGISADSIDYAVAADLVVGMTLRDSEAAEHACIAQAHNSGDRLPENESFRCGRLNLPGETANTFTLYTDGSALWENVFEMPDGSDTLFQTRHGTHLLDADAQTVLLVFKEFGTAELIAFSVSYANGQVQMLSSPPDGEGASVANQSCAFL